MTALESYRRRLEEEEDGEVEVNFVSMVTTVGINFGGTFTSVNDLTLTDVEDSIQVLVTISSIAFISIFGMLLAAYGDYHNEHAITPEVKDFHDKKISHLHHNKVAAEDTDGESVESANTTALSEEEQMLEDALPIGMRATPFYVRFGGELMNHHKYVGIIFHYSKHFPRTLKMLSLTTNVFAMLFVQSILYPITHSDDGSCPLYNEEMSCLSESSVFNAGSPTCYWTPNDVNSVNSVSGSGSGSVGGTCAYSAPGRSIKVISLMAVIAVIISVPIAMLANWVILNILAGSSYADLDKLEGEWHLDDIEGGVDGRRGSVGARDRSRSRTSSDIGARARTRTRSRSAGVDATSSARRLSSNSESVVARQEADILGSTVAQETATFMRQIRDYRNNVIETDEERDDFDAMWGINSETGEFENDTDAITISKYVRTFLFDDNTDIHGMVVEDIATVRRDACSEILRLS